MMDFWAFENSEAAEPKYIEEENDDLELDEDEWDYEDWDDEDWDEE